MSSLEELDVENPAEVKKYAFKCDDIIDENIPNPLPGKEEGWFRMAVIGKSGCGKTNLVRCLTERGGKNKIYCCLLYTSPSPRDGLLSRMPSSA